MYKIDINEILSVPKTFRDVVDEMPTDGLVFEVVAIARHFASVLKTNLNYILASIFTALGECLGRNVIITHNIYENKGNLFTLVLGDSGDHKSPSMNLVTKSMRHTDYLNSRRFEQQLDADIQGEKKILPLFTDQMFASNCTIEKLYNILYATRTNSKTGVLLHLDEATTFFTPGAALKSKTGTIVPHIISMWDGGILQVDRVYLGKTLYIENSMLSILAGTQYCNLGSIFNGYKGIGFTSRWLYVLPSSLQERTMKNDTYFEFWNAAQERAMEMSSLRLCFANYNQAEELEKVFNECHDRLKEIDGEMAAYVIKQNYYLHRFALIIHCLNALILGDQPSDTISEEELDYAFQLCKHFIRTASISIDMMDNQEALKLPGKRILQELHRRWPITNFTALSEATGGKLDRAYASKCINNKI